MNSGPAWLSASVFSSGLSADGLSAIFEVSATWVDSSASMEKGRGAARGVDFVEVSIEGSSKALSFSFSVIRW